MMIRQLILTLLTLAVMVDMAVAGAWPREKGEAFISTQIRQDANAPDDDPVIALYGEFGASSRVTIGGKLDYDLGTEDVSYIEAFGRWHFPQRDTPLRKALSLSYQEDAQTSFVVPAFHLGRGFETAIGPGWLDAELSTRMDTATWTSEFGAYAQVGLKPNADVMTMLAVDVLSTEDNTRIDVIPSVAWQFYQGKYVQLEWSHTIEGGVKDEVAVGLWLEF